MFCMNCGSQLPDGAMFCSGCGTKQGNVSLPESNGLKLVLAKCTNCGSNLTLAESMQTAVCPYCSSEFLVEQAIHNYNVQFAGNMTIGHATIHVDGGKPTAPPAPPPKPAPRPEELIMRAKDFEEQLDFDRALKCYKDALEIDFRNKAAKEGISRVRHNRKNHVYMTSVIPCLFSKDELLEVRREAMTHIKSPEKQQLFYYVHMKDIKVKASYLDFRYLDIPVTLFLEDDLHAVALFDFIQKAQQGQYPPYD